MSHELRTPLNSLLILAKLLSDNPEQNLSDKQVEYAKTIYASGGDLLTLINEILDLSKVEAGKMPVEPREVALGRHLRLRRAVVPARRGAEGPRLQDRRRRSTCPTHIHTDPQRLQQVLKNLLANAFKFTDARLGHAARAPAASRARASRPSRCAQGGVIALLGRRHRHRHRRATSSS